MFLFYKVCEFINQTIEAIKPYLTAYNKNGNFILGVLVSIKNFVSFLQRNRSLFLHITVCNENGRVNVRHGIKKKLEWNE